MNLTDYKSKGLGAYVALARKARIHPTFLSQVTNGLKRLTYDTAKVLHEADPDLSIMEMIEQNRRLFDEVQRRKAEAAA